MDFDKIATDVFDAIASYVGKNEAAKAPEMPDLSGISIDHLITEDEMNDPKLFYANPTEIPDIYFKKTATVPFVEIWDGVYPSPMTTAFSENNTVYVRHYRLAQKKKNRPCVVMINGLHVNSNFYFDWWCWRFAAWGMDSAIVTMPYAMQRVPAGQYCGQLTIVPDTVWSLLSLKQSFQDTQVFINWLKENGTGAIGLFGVSYGGLMSGLFACQSKTTDFAILGMPPCDMVDLLNRWDYAPEWRRREANGEITMLSDSRVPALLSLCCMKPNMPPGKIFIAAGKYDHLVPPETIEKTAELWGGLPWLRMYPTGHINTFALNLRFINDAARFVKHEIVSAESYYSL